MNLRRGSSWGSRLIQETCDEQRPGDHESQPGGNVSELDAQLKVEKINRGDGRECSRGLQRQHQ
jgi:hypothetical protein